MSDDEPVPKLPRGRGLKLSMPELVKIALTAGILIAVISLAHPCGDAVSNFVMKFDNQGSGSASQAMPKPGNVDEPKHYEHLEPGMTEAETKAAIQRELDRAKAAGSAAGSGSGSAVTPDRPAAAPAAR